MRRGVGFGSAIALACVAIAAVAQAGPSDGDTTFGPQEGLRTLDTAFPVTAFYGIAIRGDGQVLAGGAATGGAASLGTPLVARYNTDGTLNPAFGGGDGVATTPTSSAAKVARDVAFAGEGAVLAGDSTVFPVDADPDVSMLIERVTQAGTLDPTFNAAGTPPGRVVTKLGSLEAGARAVEVLGDGKVLVAGFAANGSSRTAALARFNADGTPDLTFGNPATPGHRLIPYSGTSVLNALALDSQGRILVAGTLTLGTTTTQDYALVARLTAAGALDQTFAADATIKGARFFTPSAPADTTIEELAVDGQDRPVVVGASDVNGPGSQLFVARLTAAGDPDAAFSPDAPAGMLAQAPAGASASVGTGVVVDAAGLVTVSGRATAGGLQRLLLARFTAAGGPDGAFSAAGNLVLKAIGTGSVLTAGQAALTGDKPVVVGNASFTDSAKAFVARFGGAGIGPLANFTVTWPDVAPGVHKDLVRPGQPVSFDSAGSSDSDGTIAARDWDLDGDGTFEAAGTQQSRSYDDAGEVGVSLRVTDDDGLSSLATQTIRVRANIPPDAIPGVPAAGRPTARPQTPTLETGALFEGAKSAEANDPSSRDFAPLMGRRYAFTGAPSTDADGSVKEYRWALDVDGSYTDWSTDPEIEHVFWVTGRRTIRLQVRDDEGATGTWEREIEIPAPVYSLSLQTDKGAPHPGLVLRPGAKAQQVTARLSVTNNGWLDGIKPATVASADGKTIEGLKSERVASYQGFNAFLFSFPAGTPYTSGKLRFSVVVPSEFVAGSTDANANVNGKTLTRDLPVLNVPSMQLAINGMEVTQGTQKYDPDYHWFQSVGLRSDPLTYNGVKLAEGKDTYVRLHAVNYYPQTIKGVTAVLHGSLNGKALPGSPLTPVFEPKDGVKFGFPVGTEAQLDDTNGSFWFRLPYAWAKRKTKIDLRGVITPPVDEAASGVSCPSEGCASDNDLTVKAVPFRATPVIKLRILKFKRKNKELPKTPVSDITYGAHQYPIDPLRMEILPGGLWIDSSDIVADVEEDLVLKLHKLTREVAEDHDDDPAVHPHGIIVGVADIPGGRSRGTLSLPAETPGAMTLAEGKAFAHELGHVFAQEHASGCVPVGGKETVAPFGDSVYPAAPWPPDFLGRLQGYAYPAMRYLKWAPGQVLRSKAPDDIKHDLMSYCADSYDNSALSPRNWAIISDVLQLLELATYDVTPESEYTPAAGVSRVSTRAHSHAAGAAPVLYERGARAGASQVSGASLGVLGTVRADGGVTGLTTFPLKPGHKLPGTAHPAYAAVTRAADGSVVGRAPVEVIDETGHGSTVRSELRAIVPATNVASIEIHRDGVALASVAASATAPTVRIVSPKAGARLPSSGQVKVKVAIADADGKPVTTRIDWAPDGRRFSTVHLGEHAPGTTTLSVPAALIAGSRSGALRVRVDDGFRSGEAAVNRLRATGTPPQITVQGAPFDGPVGVPVALRAAALDDRGKALKGRAVEWRIGKRRVGTGTAITLRDLRAGRHTVTVRARDARGATTTERLKVRVRPAAPAFIDLRVPAKATKRARFVTVRASSTIPATLLAGGKRFSATRRARSFRVPVKRGSGRLTLTLTLRSANKKTTVRRFVARP